MDKSKTNPLICEEYNCRGLNDAKKRNDAFHWLKTERKSADIIVLTDTKCHKSVDKEIWAKEWSSEETDSIWSLGKGGSRGVAILITEKFKRREVSGRSRCQRKVRIEGSIVCKTGFQTG